MDELIFIGVDICETVKEMSTEASRRITASMADNESRAYKLGVMNTISMLRGLIEVDCMPVVHIPDLEEATELTYDELERFWFDNMN